MSLQFFKDILFDKVRQWILGDIGMAQRENGNIRITYTDGNQEYCVVFQPKRGPSLLSRIESHGVDVSNEIRQVLGVGMNFHGIRTTPGILGYSSLTFIFQGREPITFTENEDILL